MKYSLAIVIVLTIIWTNNALAKQVFPTITISDLGRPYTVIDGDCKFAVLSDDPLKMFSGGNYVETAWEGTTTKAIAKLVVDAKSAGGDAIVGLRVSTIGGNGQSGGAVSVGLDGVLACGTIVKFKN